MAESGEIQVVIHTWWRPTAEPGQEVTHEATDPEWDEEAQENILACSCGSWETRGDKAGVTAAFDDHLDAMGVPANDLEAIQRAESDLAAHISRTGGGFNWNRIILAVLATQATEPQIKAEAYAALHKAQDELIAEILDSQTAGPIEISAAGLEAIARRTTPGDRRSGRTLEREAALMGAEAMEALGDVAEAMGMDRQSIISHSPAELGVMLVATVQHRERVRQATELSRAVGQFPEILATAAPELRQALRTMLADAADALAEPEPGELGHQEAIAAGIGRPHQSTLEVSRCWCRVAHGTAEARELNRRLGL